jgi:hypothetical protein
MTHIAKALFFMALPLIILMLLLAGCGTQPVTVSVPQEVKVPVTVFCKTETVVKPSMPFDEQATRSMSLYEKSQLLLAQDQVHKSYETKLEGAIAGCAAPPVSASAPVAASSAN